MAFDAVVFEIDGLRYALPARDVCEVLRAVTVVPLPKAPPVVEGVINLRGTIVPVFDIRLRFGLSPRSPHHTDHMDHLIVARASDRLVAVRADRAADLVCLDEGSIQSVAAVVPRTDYVAGAAVLEDGLLLIHDLGTFLSEAESAGLDTALEAVPEAVSQP